MSLGRLRTCTGGITSMAAIMSESSSVSLSRHLRVLPPVVGRYAAECSSSLSTSSPPSVSFSTLSSSVRHDDGDVVPSCSSITASVKDDVTPFRNEFPTLWSRFYRKRPVNELAAMAASSTSSPVRNRAKLGAMADSSSSFPLGNRLTLSTAETTIDTFSCPSSAMVADAIADLGGDRRYLIGGGGGAAAAAAEEEATLDSTPANDKDRPLLKQYFLLRKGTRRPHQRLLVTWSSSPVFTEKWREDPANLQQQPRGGVVLFKENGGKLLSSSPCIWTTSGKVATINNSRRHVASNQRLFSSSNSSSSSSADDNDAVDEQGEDTCCNANASVSAREFHALSDDVLHHLLEKIEACCEDLDVDGFDAEYSQGVLTISLGNMGTYVLNKQAPNRQIWLSSPVSGPSRFDYSKEAGSWIYLRDNAELISILEKELSQLLGEKIHLN